MATSAPEAAQGTAGMRGGEGDRQGGRGRAQTQRRGGPGLRAGENVRTPAHGGWDALSPTSVPDTMGSALSSSRGLLPHWARLLAVPFLPGASDRCDLFGNAASGCSCSGGSPGSVTPALRSRPDPGSPRWTPARLGPAGTAGGRTLGLNKVLGPCRFCLGATSEGHPPARARRLSELSGGGRKGPLNRTHDEVQKSCGSPKSRGHQENGPQATP